MIPKVSSSRRSGGSRQSLPVLWSSRMSAPASIQRTATAELSEKPGAEQISSNDPSLALMNRIARSHAEAGADIVAPSCMLDGVVASIRSSLDSERYEDVLIMAYSTKFLSALYGPFREAADSGFAFGDRSTYQINPGNSREAFLESQLDAGEGADILMVKPAGFYLDVLVEVANSASRLPRIR